MRKSPKFLLTIISVLIALHAFIYTQSVAVVPPCYLQRQEERRPQARKFDEYGMNSASFGDMKARLDGLFAELQREPDSLAYIFIYGSRRVRPRYRSIQIRNYMELRGLPSDRLRIARGGNRAEPMLEFWIVPQGAVPPEATPPYRRGGRRRH